MSRLFFNWLIVELCIRIVQFEHARCIITIVIPSPSKVTMHHISFFSIIIRSYEFILPIIISICNFLLHYLITINIPTMTFCYMKPWH